CAFCRRRWRWWLRRPWSTCWRFWATPWGEEDEDEVCGKGPSGENGVGAALGHAADRGRRSGAAGSCGRYRVGCGPSGGGGGRFSADASCRSDAGGGGVLRRMERRLASRRVRVGVLARRSKGGGAPRFGGAGDGERAGAR